MQDKILINDKLYEIEVARADSDHVGYVRLKADRIIIKIPSRISRQEQFDMYRKLIAKVEKYLQRHKNREFHEKAKIRFCSNQNVEIMGRHFSIYINETGSKISKAVIEGDAIKIYLSGGLSKEKAGGIASSLARRAISRVILPDFVSRVEQFNSQFFRSKIGDVRLKDNGTNWGSCSGKNAINLDFRLAFAPQGVRDAVIVHELAHTVHRNHSENFWNLVYSVMPDYKERRKWLSENKHRLAPGCGFEGIS
ncbi:MAG: M48 family metallopeptidase [Candidatus Marsarchaeota archaeon]|nr:M48 family metallopeptidase [Candidatus Marsarchaeota archaeon]MCL5106314.1 M48 family metallopeptidase [Candidatus Marsarchaeota archaeon]